MEPKRVLVVEDSPYLAESLQDMLEMRGFNALIAPNGRDGVAMAIEHKPDLILLDIRLPDISGYEVYKLIRENAWGRTANIVVLTASESTENIAKNIDLPAENVLFKPEWGVKELLAYIEKKLL